MGNEFAILCLYLYLLPTRGRNSRKLNLPRVYYIITDIDHKEIPAGPAAHETSPSPPSRV
jgi:hypothetical protein